MWVETTPRGKTSKPTFQWLASGVVTALVQTLRLLARSHRRFTEDQKTKVFRSIIKEARMKEGGVELEMYVQPTQNIWWKYRQKAKPVSRNAQISAQTIRIRTRQALARS